MMAGPSHPTRTPSREETLAARGLEEHTYYVGMRITYPDFCENHQFHVIYWVVAEIGPDGFCSIPDLVQIWSRFGPDLVQIRSRSRYTPNQIKKSGQHVRTCCPDSGPSLDRSRPHFHTLHIFCRSGPPCRSIKADPPGSHPPYCTQPLSAFEEDRGGGWQWAAAAAAVDAAHDGEGSATREREAVMQQSTIQSQRGATRDTRLDERTREGQLDERGAAQCERRWHDERGVNITTSLHE